MRFLNAVEQAKWHIKTLWKGLAILALLNAFTLFGWMHAQSKIRIAIPPQIPQSGLIIQQGQVPKSTVYSFAYYIWQSVNHWQKNGLMDYKKTIETFSPFLTPRFKLSLIRNYNNLLSEGELQDRIRLLSGLANHAFKSTAVKSLGAHTWQVTLRFHLTEMINSNVKVVKDVDMEYVLRIVTQDADASANPWGLMIDGYSKSPRRLTTHI